MVHPALTLPSSPDLAAWCERHGIARLALFGSALTDRFRPDSDVDVLVWFLPGRTPHYIRLYTMKLELETMFGGRTVDLLTPAALSRYIRDEVLAALEVIYLRHVADTLSPFPR